MKANRKTATILCAAGGLVAAAVILGHHRGAAGGLGIETPAPDPSPVGSCGKGAPARARADFGHGELSAALSAGRVLRASGGEIWMAVDLDTRERKAAERPPLNLAIVIDRSGSMSPGKLLQAQAAARGLVERLGPADRVAVVQYDDTAQVIVPMTATDAEGKARLRQAIDGIVTGGSTNLHDGLSLGRDEVLRRIASGAAGSVNRVLLLSDGLANVGVVDTPSIARAAGAAAERGVRVTTVGVGLDYNEDLMEAIAESGRGQYYYVRDAAGLEAVFAGELRAMQATVATRAELRLEPACDGVEIVEVAGYETRKDGAATVVPMADLFGGDRRKVVVKLRAPASRLGPEDLLRVRFSYDDAAQGGGRKTTTLALGVEVSDDPAAVDASADKDILKHVLEVESARTMREATAAYERGDRDGALRILGAGRAKAEEKARKYALPPSATQSVYHAFDEGRAGIAAYEPTSAAGKDFIKGTKVKSREMQKKK